MHFVEKEVPMLFFKRKKNGLLLPKEENLLWVTFGLVHPKKPTRHKIERVKDFHTSLFLSQKVRPSIMQVRKLFLKILL